MAKIKTKKIGPGGMKCLCCRPIDGTKAECKKFLSRYDRRTAKQDIRLGLMG